MPSPAKPRLLIADDTEAITTTLKLIFEMEGYFVESAGTAKEAITKLKQKSFDVVIADLNMEAADVGLDVARHAKSLHDPPVVILSTGSTDAAFPEPEKLGVDLVSLKPADISTLKSSVAELLAQRRKGRGAA